jgi:hypothetical protein
MASRVRCFYAFAHATPDGSAFQASAVKTNA